MIYNGPAVDANEVIQYASDPLSRVESAPNGKPAWFDKAMSIINSGIGLSWEEAKAVAMACLNPQPSDLATKLTRKFPQLAQHLPEPMRPKAPAMPALPYPLDERMSEPGIPNIAPRPYQQTRPMTESEFHRAMQYQRVQGCEWNAAVTHVMTQPSRQPTPTELRRAETYAEVTGCTLEQAIVDVLNPDLD